MTPIKPFFYDLKDKVSIVTGAAQGIGENIALRLAEHGTIVVIVDTNAEKARAVSQDIQALGCKSVSFTADIANRYDVERMTDEVLKNFGSIDFLINNAGVRTITPFSDLTEKEWDLVLDVNLKGIFLCSQCVSHHMKKTNFGRIVNISSVLAIQGMSNRAHYCSSKAGVSSLTRVMAIELARFNIRVNAVGPGIIKTPMGDDNPPQALKEMVDRIPMARLGNPEEISLPVLFLLSDASNYITGQTIFVDGGWTTNIT